MSSDYYDYQRDTIENQLMQRSDWEQEQANMADYYAKRNQQTKDELVEYLVTTERAQFNDSRRQEMEDLRLVSDLRDLADRIERRYR